MQYDPIKDSIGSVVRTAPVLRRLFYFTLGMMFLRTWFVKRELRMMLKDRKGPFTLFDAGSGFGQYSYWLAKRWPNVSIHAIDVKEDYIEDCRQFFAKEGLSNVAFGVEDLTVPKHTDRFDVIISVDVMEHIADDVTVFKNFHAALRKNGTLLINTPSNLGGSDVHGEGEESFIGEHARDGYSKEDITEKLTIAGFTDIVTKYSYGPVGSVAWRLGIKYPMMMLNVSKLFFIILPFYYLATLWLTLILMRIDYSSTNAAGTGIIVTARKR